jgi:hypothetical protein
MRILLALLCELSGQLDDTFIMFYEQTNRHQPTRFLGRFGRVWTWIGQFSPMYELATRFLHPLLPWHSTLANIESLRELSAHPMRELECDASTAELLAASLILSVAE